MVFIYPARGTSNFAPDAGLSSSSLLEGIKMVENPFARIMQRGFEAIAEAMQEELGRICQQLVQGIMTPDMLAPLMDMMRQSLGSMGIDIDQAAGMMHQQRGFDPYKILGLERSASDEEVKKRYRELLHVLHPDKSGTPGTSTFFQMVLAAFETIKRERGWQ